MPAAVSLAAAALWPGAAAAGGYRKLSGDLEAVVNTGQYPTGTSWLGFSSSGVPLVKVLVVSNSSDPEMTELRAAILAKGGSVFMRYYSVSALYALLPLDKLVTITNRSDVTSVSPNRRTARTAKSRLSSWKFRSFTPASRS